MKSCIKVLPEEYVLDLDNRRYSNTPFLHFPDICAVFNGQEIGDCLDKCGGTTIFDRPCIRKVLDNIR